MSDNGETFKTNGAPPIPRPIADEVEEQVVEQESLPELDVSDFQEMDNNVSLRTDSVKSSKSFHGNVAIYTSCDCESWQACTNDIKSSIERSRRHLECLRTIFSEVAWKVFNFLV